VNKDGDPHYCGILYKDGILIYSGGFHCGLKDGEGVDFDPTG